MASPTDDDPTSKATTEPPNLLTLPLELRLEIYDYLSLTNSPPTRKCLRLDWTANRTHAPSETLQILSLAATCTQLRAEILPTFFHSIIVKFPAWNQDFKQQCLYWIAHASEVAVRSMDCFWLECVYWRFCVRLGVGVEGEESAARERDWRQFRDCVCWAGEGFVVRVEFFEHVRERAVEAVGVLGRVLEGLLEGRERKVLKRSELVGLLGDERFCSWGFARRWKVWGDEVGVMEHLRSGS